MEDEIPVTFISEQTGVPFIDFKEFIEEVISVNKEEE